jgi:outer membrane immunogenic protein
MAAVRPSMFCAASAGLAAALVLAPAAADGIRPYGPPIWSGLYLGANLGYALLDEEGNDAVGGLQVGYNWQRGPYVLGVEADIDVISDLELGTLRGRLGVVQDRALFYGTAGIAFDDQDNRLAIGGGVEFDLGPHWRGLTAGIEALHVDHGDDDALVVRGRLSYQFR